MYILLVDSRTHKHKQRHCDKVIDHNDYLVVWTDNQHETIDRSEYTTYHTGSNKNLSKEIYSWEWEQWHDWSECHPD